MKEVFQGDRNGMERSNLLWKTNRMKKDLQDMSYMTSLFNQPMCNIIYKISKEEIQYENFRTEVLSCN